MIDDATDYYHSLLTGPRVDDASEKLAAGIARHQLYFGKRPICHVLRPLLIGRRKYDYIKRESTLVLAAIQKLYRAFRADAKLRAELELTALEEEAFAIEPGFAAPDVSGRLDAFLDSRGDFSFVEYNADSPGGLLYGDVLGEIFAEFTVMQEFAKRYRMQRVPVRPQLFKALTTAYREWGWQERPRIAIVDWHEAATMAEFVLCRQYFEAQGCPTIIVDPRELEYRGGWLRAGDFKINLVYKRVVVTELLAREGINTPLIRALRERAVCVINSLRVPALFRKNIFALLDDPQYAQFYSFDEITALRRHIPWTRKLANGRTTYHGRPIDLLEFIGGNREKLVLKPNADYGGKGVTLGWECTSEQWQLAVRNALNSPHVVQERVEVQQHLFPLLQSPPAAPASAATSETTEETTAPPPTPTPVSTSLQLTYAERFVDFAPYTWGGEDVEGAGIRLSASSLLNVSAGGGSAVPLMIVEMGD